MRKNKYIINNIVIGTACLIAALCVSSCERVEVRPVDWIDDELVWDEADSLATVATFYLNEIYLYLPSGFNRIDNDFLDAASGDAVPSRNNTVVGYYTNGQVNVLNNPDPYWGNSYAGIRRINIYLANIDKVPAKAASIAMWKAEVRFVRAMLYFELVKRYGGVPLVGDRIFSINDDLSFPRNTYEECVNYIISECDAIKTDLRKEPVTDAEWGKVPRGAAMALKCRVLLYAASPLFNGGGVESNAALRELTGYTTYDGTRWQKVIDAAEDLITLQGTPYYTLLSSYTNVFLTKKNTEVILAKQSSNNFSIETNNAPVGYGTPALSMGYTSPTQDLVDAFPMVSGLPITEDPAYDPNNPYVGRDPRMAATIFYNGRMWLSRPIETFDGGRDKPGGNAVQTKTGYYLRKFMFDFANSSTYTNQSHNFILFRYAEVLLNYAEALNEMDRTEDAVAQIIKIRTRAGIQAGADTRYGIPAAISKDDMRKLIQNERRIELAFEEHRFWDLRRWKLADEVLNSPLHGMKIVKNPDATLTYSVVEIGTPVFQERLYHMPLPYSEIVKNPNLKQNEGW